MHESRYRELKEKMAALKSLYASRHYSQCAKFGELLLSEIHDQTHPLHLAHLNFYTALSHDTLAREATLKNRWKELSLADHHYTAAIQSLSTLQPQPPSDPWSPTSTASVLSSPYSRRRSSVSSAISAASSATSLDDNEYPSAHPSPKHSRHPSTSQDEDLSTRPRTSAFTPPSTTRPQTPQQFYFSANITSFTHLLEAHSADVRAQKEKAGIPTVRFAMPSPRTSPVKAGAVRHVSERWSRGFEGSAEREEEERMDRVREMRRRVVFRPRFDAEGVRRLCAEALAELEG